MTDETRPENSNIKSPCVGICTLDKETSICSGCFRHVDEIIDWTAYADEEKRTVLEKCKTRAKNPALHKNARNPIC